MSKLKFIHLSMAIIIMASLLSGCWSRRELNELYVALAIGIDKVDDQYEVTVQVADPSQMSRNRSGDRTATTVFTARASSVIEAIRKMTTSSSRRMYVAHVLFVILDEEMAKSGIREPLDLIFRESEIRPDFTLAVVRNYTSKDVLELITPTEILPAMDLHKSLIISEKVWAPTSSVRVKDLLQTLTKEGIEPILTGLMLEGDIKKGKTAENVKQQNPAGKFKYQGIGVFKNDQLKGWLSTYDSKAYTYIVNNITSTVGSVKCPHSKQEFTSEVTRSRMSRQPTIVKDKPHMKLKLKIDANVAEMYCTDIDLNKQKDIDLLQQAAKESLKRIIDHGIHTVQSKYEADIFGFGEDFHRKYPRVWSQWKHQWNDMFKTLTYDLDIEYRINQYGQFGNPIKSKKE